MKKAFILTITAIFASLSGLGISSADAQVRPYRVTNTQVRTLLTRIETKTDTYQRQMQAALNRSRLNGSDTEDMIRGYISDFEAATDTLKRRVNSNGTIYSEVNDVLTRAAYIDQFMGRNNLARAAENQWVSVRTDLNTLARYYNLSWNWNQSLPTYPGNPGGIEYNAQADALLRRIESKTDTFKDQINRSLDRSSLNNTRAEDNILAFIDGFENSTDQLRRRYDSRERIGNEVNDVLNRATYIDQFMGRRSLNRAAENQWVSIRNDLNSLATYYRLSWNWNQRLPQYPDLPSTGGNFPIGNLDQRVSGTYRLNTTQSDNVDKAVSEAVNRYYTGTQRENVRRRLERRLASPEMIAIDKNGRSVTMASTNSQQVTFDLNGVARTETNNNGRTTRITASSENDGFSIDYVGDRANDFYVDFSADRNGQLRVTRRIYLENRNETVSVTSVYNKTDSVARWSDVGRGTWNGNTGSTGDFYVPNGTQITATLRSNINTRDSQVGDRFSMEVTSPSQYRGAIIEGRVTGKDSSGRVSGRANVSLDFDSITLNGRNYRFAGLIDSVRTINGDTVSVSNEGTVRDSNQTTRTVTRAGIGAAIGAIIGAIAGGGQGAAIGAAVGAGAGAGTVLIQGRDNIELQQGTVFNITASAPNNYGSNR